MGDGLKPRIVMGIDPGVTGGIAVIWPNHRIWAADFPLIEERKPNHRKPREGAKTSSAFRTEREYDLPTLRRWLKSIDTEKRCPITVYLEQVTSMPRDGSTQAFKFGKCFGEIRGILAGLGLKSEQWLPKDWMRNYGFEKRGDKQEREEICRRRLYEELGDEQWQDRQLTEGTVDALLLAMMGRRLLGLNAQTVKVKGEHGVSGTR